MNDFESRLTAVLDDVAKSVRPHPDPDSVFFPMVQTVPNNVRVLRPRYFAVAAASLLLVGGSAFAMERISGDQPTASTPAESPVTEPTEPPTTVESTSTSIDEVVNVTPARETVFKPTIVKDREAPATEPTVPPTEPTVAPTEPTVAPVVIEFTAKLGADGRANTPMTQGFYGKAQPGSAIRVASQYGVSETTANDAGEWETTLTMREVPAGTKVAVRITSSTSTTVSGSSRSSGPAPPAPAVIEFTAALAPTARRTRR